MPVSDFRWSELSGSARRMFGILTSVLENRAELFALEFREQQFVLIRILLLMFTLLFFAMLFFVLLIVTFIYFLGSEWRLTGLIIVTAISGILTILLFVRAYISLRNLPQPFSATVEALRKDRELL